ncbi:ATP-binding protein [Streptomyces acidiscabies]|uniref:ATP-binding protein n=1 Tax=Streptomyces acidiscabies TaxID=42234 RepID=UPI0038F61785
MPGYDATEPRLRCVLPFEAAPAEVPLLRRAVAKQLSQWGVPAAAEEAELLGAELATNVVKHVGEGGDDAWSWRAGGSDCGARSMTGAVPCRCSGRSGVTRSAGGLHPLKGSR